MDIEKASSNDDIPAKIIIGCSDIVSPFIREIYDKALLNCEFPTLLKFADISPFHKKDERTKKEHYRPISILPIISEILERNMSEQISKFIDKNLSPYLSAFRKGYNTQHCLLLMIEKWKNALDNKKHAGAILTDLSKAFDCINHELLIAKLEAYGFGKNALKFIHSYITGRIHRTNVNNILRHMERYNIWSTTRIRLRTTPI